MKARFDMTNTLRTIHPPAFMLHDEIQSPWTGGALAITGAQTHKKTKGEAISHVINSIQGGSGNG